MGEDRSRILELLASGKITADEAARFGCNAVSADGRVVLPAGCPKLARDLEGWGCTVHEVELGEYIKSGGAAKCLTLRLD